VSSGWLRGAREGPGPAAPRVTVASKCSCSLDSQDSLQGIFMGLWGGGAVGKVLVPDSGGLS